MALSAKAGEDMLNVIGHNPENKVEWHPSVRRQRLVHTTGILLMVSLTALCKRIDSTPLT